MKAMTGAITTPSAGRALRLTEVLSVIAVTLVGVLLAVAILFFAGGNARAQTLPLSGKTVVIDPGHGGSDLGATYTFSDNSKISEREQNLDVAYKLRELLRDQGATVFLTRERVDQNPTNAQRAQFANERKADLLISIHMNGSSDKSVDYTSTLFGKWQKDKAFAYAVFGDNVDRPKITPPTFGLRTLPAVNGKGTSWGTIATRTPYSYASGVLLKSNMPATIAETVFITNTEEARQLAAGWTGTPVGRDYANGRQQRIAEALDTGIVRYLAPASTSG